MLPDLLWCDVETTGLDPQRDHLLEVALVKTNSQLQIVGERTITFALPCDSMDYRCDPVVREMHNANFLWSDCSRSLWTKGEADDHLTEWAGPGPHILAGSQVHFDRAFVRQALPKLYRTLKYKQFDLQTLRFLRGSNYEHRVGKAHRALPDLYANIEELKRLL